MENLDILWVIQHFIVGKTFLLGTQIIIQPDYEVDRIITYLEGVVGIFLGREPHVETGPGPGVACVLFLLIEAWSLV